MIDAQLGPPPAVASRGGSAPAGGPADIAPAAHPDAEQGSFGKALESRTAPPSSDAHRAEQAAHTDKQAAGPRKGELQEEDAADAGASQDEKAAAAGIAAAIASAVATVVPAVAAATPPSGALAGAQQAEVVQAAPPQPLAGLVPAALDGKGGVVPATAAPQAQAATAGVPAAAPATTAATATAVPAPAPVTGAAVATTAPAAGAPPAQAAPDGPPANAVVTLTITPAPPTDAAGPAAGGSPAVTAAPAAPPAPGGPAAPAAPAPAPATATATATAAAPAADAGKAPAPAPAQAPAAQDAPRSTAATAEPPAGAIAPAPVQQPAAPDPLGGIVRPSGGLTTPHELARELGERVHMAVREGGRELVVNLRPAELGHLTIRVVMHEGVMQASIVADRPEAARMLQQSMGHLDAALGDLGYSLGNLDVAYNGQDARDAQSSSKGNDSPVSGEVLEADGTPAVSGSPTRPASTTSSRLDILA